MSVTGIVDMLLVLCLSFVVVLVDFAATMLVVRMVSTRCRAGWIGAIETAGRPLTDLVLDGVGRAAAVVGFDGELRTGAKFLLALIGLFLIRLAVLGVLHMVTTL